MHDISGNVGSLDLLTRRSSMHSVRTPPPSVETLFSFARCSFPPSPFTKDVGIHKTTNALKAVKLRAKDVQVVVAARVIHTSISWFGGSSSQLVRRKPAAISDGAHTASKHPVRDVTPTSYLNSRDLQLPGGQIAICITDMRSKCTGFRYL